MDDGGIEDRLRLRLVAREGRVRACFAAGHADDTAYRVIGKTEEPPVANAAEENQQREKEAQSSVRNHHATFIRPRSQGA